MVMQAFDINNDNHLQLSQAIIGLLDQWGVSDSEQITLLGLPDKTRSRVIRKYRKDTPIPLDDNVREHIDHLMGIADALHTSFPLNEMGGSMWMNRSNTRFQNRKPIRAMVEDGLEGLLAVRRHLDCAYDWHTNG